MKLHLVKSKFADVGNGKFRAGLNRLLTYEDVFQYVIANGYTFDLETLKLICIGVVEEHLDAVARTRGYDNIISLCTYATDPDPTFSAEAQAGIAWRSSVWKDCMGIFADIQAGTREVPSPNELIAALPTINW